MLSLGVNTATNYLGIGLAEDGQIISDLNLTVDQSHNRRLLPGIKYSLDQQGIKLEEIDIIGAIVGPGSFTGLRIALATIKAFGLINKFEFVPISSLDTLVPTIERQGYYLPMLDARRKRVYTALYQGGFSLPNAGRISYDAAVKVSELKNFLAGNITDEGQDIIFSGPGAIYYKDKIDDIFTGSKYNYHIINEYENTGQGGRIARLAYYYYKEGFVKNIREVTPEYLKKPQAEINWQRQQKEDNQDG
ncbi:MAG: tRNA (adenosine(37)-N6)-threonylcarbamoyltransferase complex dimerization subunit type 1 TsaB [Bacillota bacterium]